jgi:hypothetical protein
MLRPQVKGTHSVIGLRSLSDVAAAGASAIAR